MRNAVWLLLLLLSTLSAPSFAQNNIPPKREFRGAWIATVTNIDFPSKPGLTQDKFTDEWTKTLDVLQSAGFNAVFAQVRPAGDAFYRSKIAPWSKYLTGKQGVEPTDYEFDPLTYMVDEAHVRNLEFHAWLNPFRASMDTSLSNLSPVHPYKAHPEWFIRYGGKLYFNPAVPAARNYITEVVMEIVMEYDVDGIHFDDYFYPYPAQGEVFPDSADFVQYGHGFASVADWRRNNVDLFISQVSQMIKLLAPHVKFGISPFGVWRNVSKDPTLGSATRAGVNTYDDLFADVRGWLEKGWIDYVAPQLYWNIGFAPADYEILVDWWRRNAFDKHVYIGHAAYKVDSGNEGAWKNPVEIPRQIRLNRQTAGVGGSIFYNTSSLRKNPLGVLDSLRNRYFVAPALPPEMPYLNLPQPAAPTLGKPKMKRDTLTLTVSLPRSEKNAAQIIIYRFEDRLPGDFNNPLNIFALIPWTTGSTSVSVQDAKLEEGKIYTYVASAMNRQHSEGNLSASRTVQVLKKKLKVLK